MFANTLLGVLLGTLLLIASIPDAVSYSKYGRTCRDIGCLSDEVCVMAEDPCTPYSDKCGRYPTCRKARAGEASCASMVCQDNAYCKVENGAPKCVKKDTSVGFESAGVSYVNGQRVSSDDTAKPANANESPSNPYANANAPPADHVGGGGYHQVNAGNNLGYPAYPNNAGSSNAANNGYPPYPSSNQGTRQQQNSGYPPYPTHDRMPGQSGYPAQGSGYPGYPGGYPQQNYPGQRYPAGQYPGYQNYPYQNYPNQNHRGYSYNSNSIYRKNGEGRVTASTFVALLMGLLVILVNRS